MKQLLIVRHAKSDWNDFSLSDFDRPLNSRGEKNAPEMAARLVKKEIIPQQIVSSPALRAITTAKHFASILGIAEREIVETEDIYEAMPSTLLQVINNLNESSSFTALFGHNPGVTGIINDLCGIDLGDISTCGMALINLPFDSWKMVSKGTGELVFYDYPKNGDD